MIMSTDPEPSNEQLDLTQPPSNQDVKPTSPVVPLRHAAIFVGSLVLLTIVFLSIGAVTKATMVSAPGTVIAITQQHRELLCSKGCSFLYTYQVSYTLNGQFQTATIPNDSIALSPGDPVTILVHPSNPTIARNPDDYEPWTTIVGYCIGFFAIIAVISFLGQAAINRQYKQWTNKTKA